jgi:hypothetical protein
MIMHGTPAQTPSLATGGGRAPPHMKQLTSVINEGM